MKSQEWADGWMDGAVAMLVLMQAKDRAGFNEMRDEYLAVKCPDEFPTPPDRRKP